MYQILQLVTLSLFAGTTCAVFYIPGSVVSYPKMGKRAFYTNATGNRYPLMGRRSSPTNAQDSGNSHAEGVMGAMMQDSNEYNKRGVFTQGPHRSFPRVGRSGQASETSDATVTGKIRSEILKSLAERLNRNVLDALEGSEIRSLVEDPSGHSGESSSLSLKGMSAQLPQFLFLIFDEDGDNQLSKEEFTTGVAKIMEQNLLC